MEARRHRRSPGWGRDNRSAEPRSSALSVFICTCPTRNVKQGSDMIDEVTTDVLLPLT